MANQFDFDETKSAQENIDAFLTYIESTNKVLGLLLRKHLDKMLPLPDPNKRSAARASFNAEIKKMLDVVLTASKAKHG
jgi:hypothetical protein